MIGGTFLLSRKTLRIYGKWLREFRVACVRGGMITHF